MSLYALPGLFPPLAFSETKASTSSSSTRKGASSTSLTFESAALTGGAIERGSSLNCNGAMEDDPAVHDASWEKEDRESEIIAGGRPAPQSLETSTTANQGSSLVAPVVAIREARIDAARLIHSIILGTTSNKPPGAAPTNRRTDPLGPTSRARIQRRSRPTLPSDPAGGEGGDDNSDELPVTPQEECMVFELAVRLESADGSSCWSFETTRRLEGFLELRRELVRELWSSSASSSPRDAKFDIPPPVPRVQHDETSSTFDGGTAFGVGTLTSGNAGRGGFVFLQALIRAYVPVLENWLRTVLEELPISDPQQSYALSNFLFQPLDDHPDEGREASSVMPSRLLLLPPSSTSQSWTPPYASVSPSQSAASFRPLDSIEESEEVEG